MHFTLRNLKVLQEALQVTAVFYIVWVGHVTPAESQRWVTLRFALLFSFSSAAFTFDLWEASLGGDIIVWCCCCKTWGSTAASTHLTGSASVNMHSRTHTVSVWASAVMDGPVKS